MINLWPALRQRHLVPERMDAPGLDPASHARALAGLRRINRFSRASAPFWPLVRELAPGTTPPLRILDLGCGGGDVLLDLALRARTEKLAVQLSGADASPTALTIATQHLQSKGFAFQPMVLNLLDPAALTTQAAPADLVICSLVLHHFTFDQALQVLQWMRKASRRAACVSDLLRSSPGYALALLGTRLLTRSPIVHADGPQSVRAAFSLPEVLQLARAVGWDPRHLRTHWPQRWSLTWRH